MEGDLVSVKSNLVKNISTHALTWRATVFVITNTIFPQDFYPRPHMEGDKNPGRSVPPGSDFYPRPHMEGDALKTYIEGTDFISTHALTWRATRRKIKASVWRLFLPTPSHGGRHTDISSPCAFRDFYPRPHMEGDLSLSNISLITLKFLPTPSHGGRPCKIKSR